MHIFRGRSLLGETADAIDPQKGAEGNLQWIPLKSMSFYVWKKL